MECNDITQEQTPVAAKLHRTFFNFRLAMAVEYAFKLGLFGELVRQPMSVDELSCAVDIPVSALEPICSALIANDILDCGPDRILTLPDGLASDLDLNSYAPLASLMYLDCKNRERWHRYMLERGLNREGEFNHIYNAAMTYQNAGVVDHLLATLQNTGAHHITELGSGPAELSARFVQSKPGNSATCVDVNRGPDLEALGLNQDEMHRITWLQKDLLEYHPSACVGDIVLSRILMGYDTAEKQGILSHLRRIMSRNRYLLINEFDPQTKVGSLLNLEMMINWDTSITSDSETERLIHSAGFEVVSVSPSSAYTKIWVCQPCPH